MGQVLSEECVIDSKGGGGGGGWRGGRVRVADLTVFRSLTWKLKVSLSALPAVSSSMLRTFLYPPDARAHEPPRQWLHVGRESCLRLPVEGSVCLCLTALHHSSSSLGFWWYSWYFAQKPLVILLHEREINPFIWFVINYCRRRDNKACFYLSVGNHFHGGGEVWASCLCAEGCWF